jgi:hypothetical protein
MQRILPAFLILAFAVSASEAAVEFRRAGDAPKGVVDWFSSLDALLDDYQTARAQLIKSARSGNNKSVLKAADSISEMAQRYHTVTGDADGAAKARTSIGNITTWQAAVSLEKGSLYRWAQIMRQAALNEDGPQARIKANALVTYRNDKTLRQLAVLDISGSPLVENGVVRSSALEALIEILKKTSIEKGTYVVGDRRLWARVFGARFYFDTAALGNDGLIRIRYEEKDGSIYGQSSFYFLTRALWNCGFSVSVQNGEMVAVPSGKRVRLDAYDRVERFSAALAAFSAARELRRHLDEVLAGSISQSDNALRLDELARIFAAEGRLPFLKGKGKLTPRLLDYRRRNGDREALRADMGRTLIKFGLPLFPPDVAVGQRSIDLHYNSPISAAIARGDIVRRKGVLTAVKRRVPWTDILGKKRTLLLPAGRSKVVGQVRGRIVRRVQRRSAAGKWTKSYHVTTLGSPGTRFGHDAEPLGSIKNETVEGVVTYDPKRVESTSIFVTPYLRPADKKTLSLANGVLTTDGGIDDAFAGVLAGKTVLNLYHSQWSDRSGLRLEIPVYGRAVEINGQRVRGVSGGQWLFLREGDRVRLNPKKGVLEIIE